MYQHAIKQVLGFTRPMHTLTRTYGGLILPGSSTLFFVNNEGVAITCKHVLQLITAADDINAHFQQFKAERNRLAKDHLYKTHVTNLERKYNYSADSTVQVKNNFLNCFDQIEQITYHPHPTLDLAVLEFKGFNNILYSGHARFLKNTTQMAQGQSLCRIGFPFPEYNNFRHNPDTDDIEWTAGGTADSPSFPMDGIITRFVAKGQNQPVEAIEMSTPGLRGQSGGPLFDSEGIIYGMQYATQHLHLGFDLHDQEIIQDGKKKKVSNSPFLHVGLCIHAERIKDFLRQLNICFHESEG